jgi:hypothetical protein
LFERACGIPAPVRTVNFYLVHFVSPDLIVRSYNSEAGRICINGIFE